MGTLIVSAIVSFLVSVWYSKRVLDKVVEVMTKMDDDQRESFKEMSQYVLAQIDRLKNIRG